MITISNDYKNHKNSALRMNKQSFDYFHVNLVEIPILQKILAERKKESSYFPLLFRDLWLIFEQPFDDITFSDELDFSNEVTSQIIQHLYEHPTFHIIYDLTQEKTANSFISALLLAEIVSRMIDKEIKQSMHISEENSPISLSNFVMEKLHISNCLEIAAKAILHMSKELPIFVDIEQFVRLPLPERTSIALKILKETINKNELINLFSISRQ